MLPLQGCLQPVLCSPSAIIPSLLFCTGAVELSPGYLISVVPRPLPPPASDFLPSVPLKAEPSLQHMRCG